MSISTASPLSTVGSICVATARNTVIACAAANAAMLTSNNAASPLQPRRRSSSIGLFGSDLGRSFEDNRQDQIALCRCVLNIVADRLSILAEVEHHVRLD